MQSGLRSPIAARNLIGTGSSGGTIVVVAADRLREKVGQRTPH